MASGVGAPLFGEVLVEASVQIRRDAGVITAILTLKNVDIIHRPSHLSVVSNPSFHNAESK